MAKKRYKSVSDLMTDVFQEDDPQFVDELGNQIHQRKLVRMLATLRNVKNITQEDIAKEMQCAQSRVSKIENGLDADLRMSDILAYAKAIHCNVEIGLHQGDQTLVDEIKYFAFRMKQCFDKLAHLANQDESIASGVAKFHIEAIINLVTLVQTSAQRLPRPEGTMPILRLSVFEEDFHHQDQVTGECPQHSFLPKQRTT